MNQKQCLTSVTYADVQKGLVHKKGSFGTSTVLTTKKDK